MRRTGGAVDEEHSMVNVKVLRPEGKGSVAVKGFCPTVPTSPDALSHFIHTLPESREPIYYCPQHPVTANQQAQLQALLPAWAMPLR